MDGYNNPPSDSGYTFQHASDIITSLNTGPLPDQHLLVTDQLQPHLQPQQLTALHLFQMHKELELAERLAQQYGGGGGQIHQHLHSQKVALPKSILLQYQTQQRQQQQVQQQLQPNSSGSSLAGLASESQLIPSTHPSYPLLPDLLSNLGSCLTQASISVSQPANMLLPRVLPRPSAQMAVAPMSPKSLAVNAGVGLDGVTQQLLPLLQQASLQTASTTQQEQPQQEQFSQQPMQSSHTHSAGKVDAQLPCRPVLSASPLLDEEDVKILATTAGNKRIRRGRKSREEEGSDSTWPATEGHPIPSPPFYPLLGQTHATQSPPTSADSIHVITQFLMQYNRASDTDFSRKAIEGLIKRLRDRREHLDVLIQAVHHHHHHADGGTQQEEADNNGIENRCVIIPRTLDGRLQIATKKGFPHVVYARIFRWPALQRNELHHWNDGRCQAPFDMKSDSVCVNPYHYRRIAASIPPSPIEDTMQVIPAGCLHGQLQEFSDSSSLLRSNGEKAKRFDGSCGNYNVHPPAETSTSGTEQQQQQIVGVNGEGVELTNRIAELTQCLRAELKHHRENANSRQLTSDTAIKRRHNERPVDENGVALGTLRMEGAGAGRNGCGENRLDTLRLRDIFPASISLLMQLVAAEGNSAAYQPHGSQHQEPINLSQTALQHQQLASFSSPTMPKQRGTKRKNEGSHARSQVEFDDLFLSPQQRLGRISDAVAKVAEEEKTELGGGKCAALLEPLLTLLRSAGGRKELLQTLVDTFLVGQIQEAARENRARQLNENPASFSSLMSIAQLSSSFRPHEGKSASLGTIFSVSYYEFGQSHGTRASPASILHCGPLPPPGLEELLEPSADGWVGKEHFGVGAGKMADGLTPLQAQLVHDCHRCIGSSGIVLEWTPEGEVYLRCASRRPVYVLSAYLDHEASLGTASGKLRPRTHVIYQQANIQVHDLLQCGKQLDEWLQRRSSPFLGKNAQQLEEEKNSTTTTKREEKKGKNAAGFAKALEAKLDSLCRVCVSFSNVGDVAAAAAAAVGSSKKKSASGNNSNIAVNNWRSAPCWLEITMERSSLALRKMLAARQPGASTATQPSSGSGGGGRDIVVVD